MKVMRTQLHPARQLIQPGHLIRRFDCTADFRDFSRVLLMQGWLVRFAALTRTKARLLGLAQLL
jgi:hypothetical protein